MALRSNPFQPNKMVAPGMFTGRAEEIFSIEQCLFQAKHGNPQHFLIEGERGIGKSSLLFLVSSIASGQVEPIQTTERFSFVTLSIDLAGVTDQLDIVRAIARKLKSAVNSRKALKERASQVWEFLSNWEVAGVRYHKPATSDADDARDALVDAVAELCSTLQDEIDGVFIVIDEADAPPESAGLGEFLKLFTERLTRVGCDRVILGLAGLPNTVAKLRGSHASSPRLFEILKLTMLTDSESRQVVAKGISEANQKNDHVTKITEDAIALIAELSEGYPHFIQEFGYCAFAEDSDYVIDSTDVTSGAYKENGALMQLGNKFFSQMYHAKISSEDYRQVLRTMATYGDTWVTRQQIIKEAGVLESSVNNALATLKNREIIIADDTRRGFYRLPTRSFAAWINAIQSVSERQDGDAEQTLFDKA